MEWLTAVRWSPYVVGAGIGLLSCLSFLLSNKPLGCSSAFARTSGMLEGMVRGDKVHGKEYYRKLTPKISWDWMLVAGVIAGAFISALSSGSLHLIMVPEVWARAAGESYLPRGIIALAGGILIGFGSRWAGGCTSGHGISGTLQLAVSSWIAACCFFVAGIAAAMLLFRVFLGV